MPRYFFHVHTAEQIILDRVGMVLPDFDTAPDQEMAKALWQEAFDARSSTGQTLVVTDEVGSVMFVTAT
jgi:ATP:corrinoid adenosyltransferase